MAKVARSALTGNGWTKGAGNAWYYYYDEQLDTHLHLGASGGGDELDINFLSFKIENVPQGNIMQYKNGTFSVSFADGIRDKSIATVFVNAVNTLNSHIT
ncbi:hypothetical protein NR798_35985 [Archangium gephyra]|uniref:hypothetical protein n=1 Tax=Archangium gephyra TaxID=48 RepID=UPI0035D4379A